MSCRRPSTASNQSVRVSSPAAVEGREHDGFQVPDISVVAGVSRSGAAARIEREHDFWEVGADALNGRQKPVPVGPVDEEELSTEPARAVLPST